MKHKNILCPPIVILALVIFSLFTIGGCGGSTSNNFASTGNSEIISGANAIFEKSAWRYDSGTVTANVNGVEQNLTVYDFAVYFQDCDIEDESGAAEFAAFAAMKGENFMLPLVFDFSEISTRREGNSWEAETEHGNFTIELTSETEARMTGTIAYKIGQDIEIHIDVLIKKYDASTGPAINLDEVLNATWMTTPGNDGQNSEYGGGYVYSSTDGAIPIDKIFSSWTFKNTNLAENKTYATMQLIVSGNNDASLYYYNFEDEEFSVSHIFGSAYRFAIFGSDGDFQMGITGALIFHDEDRAYFIISSLGNEAYGEHMDQHYAIPMYRKTDDSGKINLREKINTTWEALYGATYIIEEDNSAELESFSVTFISADIEEKKLTLSANGSFNFENENRAVNFPRVVFNYENAGYNIWTAESENGIFTISLLSDDSAILTGEIIYQGYTVDTAGLMRQVPTE